MAVVSVSLPDPLVEQADAFIAERGYAGRSELVRAALRDFLGQQGPAVPAGHRSATLTLLYPDGYERKVGEIRHDYTDIVRSMMHGHVGAHAEGRRGQDASSTKGLCVEVFVLEGAGKRIQQFADALRAAKDTRLVQTVYTDGVGGDGGHGHSH